MQDRKRKDENVCERRNKNGFKEMQIYVERCGKKKGIEKH